MDNKNIWLWLLVALPFLLPLLSQNKETPIEKMQFSTDVRQSGLTRLVNLLEIADFVIRYVEPEEKVIVKLDYPVEFYPVYFAEKHRITDKTDVSLLNEKIGTVIRKCTQKALDSGESNDTALRKIRIACLEANGFDENDKVYIKIKYPNI